MILLIIGIAVAILGVISFVLKIAAKKDKDRETEDGARNFGVIISVLAVVLLFASSIKIIPAGSTGVQTLLGRVLDPSLPSGIHMVSPLIKANSMSLRTQNYTMSVSPNEGPKQGDDSIDVLTSDGLTIKVDITCFYRLDPQKASSVYRDVGPDYLNIIVRPTIRTAVRNAAVAHSSSDLYSANGRAAYIEGVKSYIIPTFTQYGIISEEIMLRNVILPQTVTDAIEAKLKADQEQQAMTYVLQKERQEAERKGVEAEGIKIANQTIAEGLTKEYLTWYYIEMMRSLAGSPNNTFIFSPLDQSVMPLLNVPAPK